MIQLFKMALRNLGRNRRRTFFSALALGMGLALLMLIAAFISGEYRDALNTSIKLQTGHLQVRAKTYDETKSSLAWEDLIEDPQTISAQIAALQPVKLATPRLYASGIIGASDQSIGVRIVGIDPPSEANAPYRDGLVSGTYFNADDREGVLIGQSLAVKAGLKVNDQINLSANTANGDVDDQVFTIRGIYSTHTPAFDDATVMMPLAKAQAITKTESHASTIFVLLNNIDDTDAVVTALEGNAYQIQTYRQLNEIMFQTQQFSQSYMVMIYIIVLAITATVIVNTLIMSVFERTREIGILSAIGMKGSRIMAMFFAELAVLAIGGITIGLVLGSLLVAYTTKYGFYIGNMGLTGIMIGERIYTYLTVKDTVNLAAAAFIVSLLAALYPALLAARMEPVEALHGGK